MKKIYLRLLGLLVTLALAVPSYAAYELVWSDEFDCDYLNTSVWSYETGGGGWGNGESQNYTNRTDNASVNNGLLTITAKREAYGGSNFTSARLISRNKVMCKYGKVEALIKVPEYTSGVWPAFWMLGTAHNGGWPYCGEIDIMEMMCNGDAASGRKALGTYHWNYQGINGGYAHAEHGGTYTYNENLGARFRIYGLEWTPNSMTAYVADADGGNRHNTGVIGLTDATDANGLAAFKDYEFYLILNVALGGTYVGQIPNTFQQCTMQVDWVRIYQDRATYPTSTLTNNSATCGNVPGINTDYVKVYRDEALNGSVLDWSSAPFYIWEGTMTASAETAAEGDNCLSMKVGNKGWYGAGFQYSGSALDYKNLKDYTLHFRLKTSNTNTFVITVGNKGYNFTPTVANQWREYNIPVATINPTLGIDASFVPLSFNQANGEQNMQGRTFAWDDVYFYKPGGSNVANLVVNDANEQIKRKNGTATITISGSHLTQNVTLTSSNPDFTLSKTTLVPNGGQVNETVTVTFSGSATANTVITATSGATSAQGRAFSYFSGLSQIDADYVVLMSDRTFNGSVLNWGGSTFNIWYTDYENPKQPTMTAYNGINKAFEGEGYIGLQVGNKGWYGAGYVVNANMDYANLNKYKLHFAYYSSSNQPFNVSLAGSSITITPTQINQWVEYEVPVSNFYVELGESSSLQPFSILQGTGENVQAGRVIALDDIYFYIEGGSGVANLSVTTPWMITEKNGTSQFTVSGSHLTKPITLTSSNSDFSLSKTTINPVNGLVNETITITYSNTKTASSTIKVSCGDLVERVTAAASGTSALSSCSMATGYGQGTPYMATTWNWTQIYDYEYSVNGSEMNVTLNAATVAQWQAQFWMVPSQKVALTQGNNYTVKAAIMLNKDQNVTIKAVQNGGADTDYLMQETVAVSANSLYIFSKSAQSPANWNDIRLVFDFGGNEAGLVAKIQNVEIGESSCYQALEPEDDPQEQGGGEQGGGEQGGGEQGDNCVNAFETFTASRNVVNANNNWSEVAGLHNINGTTITITPQATYNNLYVVSSGDNQTLAKDETYVLSGMLQSTVGATVKVYVESRTDNESHIFDTENIVLAANTPTPFSFTTTLTKDLPQPDLTFAMTNNPTGTFVLSGVSLRKQSCTATELEESLSSQLAIYPNPAAEIVYITDVLPIQNIQIMDLTGKLLLQTSNTEVVVSSLRQGVYIVSVCYADGSVLRRQLIKK